MFEPKVGLVVRYDFLWRDDHEKGAESGKDRPCAIIVAKRDAENGGHTVLLCPITHSPPDDPQHAVEIPRRVCEHLGLDAQRSWIKTDQLNQLSWGDTGLPYGITSVKKGQWAYGEMPEQLNRQAFNQVRQAMKQKALSLIDRDRGMGRSR